MIGMLERKFWQFHADNPLVYKRLVRHARDWQRGHEHCSIALLFERVRWDFGLDTNTAENFKLNNNHKAFYARLIEKQEPTMRGLFRLRQQRIQCSFGPLNENLPSGKHTA